MVGYQNFSKGSLRGNLDKNLIWKVGKRNAGTAEALFRWESCALAKTYYRVRPLLVGVSNQGWCTKI